MRYPLDLRPNAPLLFTRKEIALIAGCVALDTDTPENTLLGFSVMRDMFVAKQYTDEHLRHDQFVMAMLAHMLPERDDIFSKNLAAIEEDGGYYHAASFPLEKLINHCLTNGIQMIKALPQPFPNIFDLDRPACARCHNYGERFLMSAQSSISHYSSHGLPQKKDMPLQVKPGCPVSMSEVMLFRLMSLVTHANGKYNKTMAEHAARSVITAHAHLDPGKLKSVLAPPGIWGLTLREMLKNQDLTDRNNPVRQSVEEMQHSEDFLYPEQINLMDVMQAVRDIGLEIVQETPLRIFSKTAQGILSTRGDAAMRRLYDGIIKPKTKELNQSQIS